jgi:ATP-dependent DNA helicase DinG
MSDSVDLLRQIVELRPGGEHRPAQEQAVEAIERAIDEKHNALVEAPTGTGKTLSYLIPLFVTKKKAVISTATKQLSEQIIKQDVPTLRRALKKVDPGSKLNAALLKGRENYWCLYKEDQGDALDRAAEAQMPIFDDSEEKAPSTTSAMGKRLIKEIKDVKDWAAETESGDRSEAPVVSDQVWRQFSATATECVGRNNCPFGEICFAERARDRARKADIVVTNHAVVGHDLMAEDEGILGERAVYVFDELHELDNYLSNAWGTRLTAKMIRDSHKAFSAYKELGQSAIDVVEQAGRRFEPALEAMEEGLITTMPPTMEALVRNLYKATTAMATSASKLMKESDTGENAKKALNVLKKRAEELSEACLILLDDSMETVRWKTATENSESLNAAPLRVGPRLQLALASRDAIMIGTSATITVAGEFDIPVHNLDMDNAGEHREYRLDTPFNYPKQAMLYIPDPDSFPAPVGSDRAEHSRAILTETEALVKAASGSALVLSTTTSGAGYLARHLRKKLPKMNILLQGEAPNPQLVESFKKDKKSVLVATMGMWHGLDVQGDANILVIMDKVPFKPMNDPLSVARQNYAESQGRSGFMDVYVADANVMLAQGAGRLIRSKDDKGVIAILDTRLLTKRYGKDMLRSLPPLVNRPRATIIEGLERLAKINDAKK